MSQVETRNSGAGDVDSAVRGASDGSKGRSHYIPPKTLSTFCQGLESLSEAEF